MGKLLPKEEEEILVVQLTGVVPWRPPAMLQQGRASMARGEEGELLHDFARERSVLGRVGGRESEQKGAAEVESSG